ncbi:hypothetical protein ICN19_08175, partial [Polynucleobacter sp. AP-Capit-er-40B-B4]|uniref:beta strand repeat-containing protein n=2 Tax=Polynucleobacter sp. AP-Capit-er-40B-B4 TaxID=2576927 RepID=UPI001C0B8BF0
LVRSAITNDTTPDNGETFTLTATNTGTTSATGTATILDDGTGVLFSSVNTSGRPEEPGSNGLPVNLNDDRPLTIAAVAPTVNEGSPYAAFVVTGSPDQLASLSFPTNTSSPLTSIEYWNGSAWVPYNSGDLITLDSAGKALVRVLLAPEQDAILDNNEPFSLTASNTGGTSATPAVVTIKDDGTGTQFTSTNPTGITPATLTPPTPVNGVVGSTDAVNLPNDDRPLAVSSVTVNEGSPYAVFTVTGATGQLTSLSLSSGTATVGTDSGTALQYFNGTAWVDYTPGSFVAIPAGGLLVRTAVTNDPSADNNETFNLVATNAGGTAVTGVGTIKDDGTGSVFLATNTTSTPDTPTVPLDDDRPLAVSSVTVNEGSPYAVFTVTGATGELTKLSLTSGTGTVGTDTATTLEYFDPTANSGAGAWVPYTPNSFVAIPAGGLLVRTAVTNDPTGDNNETVNLVATNTGGTAVTGVGTIKDDGTGSVFLATNTTSTPDTPTVPLDDDRPLTITAVAPIVNEGSPYAAFVVSGSPGQLVSLSFPTNTNSPLTNIECWNGSAWVPYNAGDLIPLDSAGKALVRVLLAPEQDVGSDNSEPFSLTATNTGGIAATPATVTIMDDGTGTVFAFTDPTNLTPAVIAAPTPVNGVVSAVDAVNLPNNDSPLSVTSVTVSEGSPYAVFKVTGTVGEYTSLSLSSGTATIGSDTGTALQYFNGTTWVDYNPGDFVQIPAGGLLVRAAISNDPLADNNETFNLLATSPGGETAAGVGTIKDDGTGVIFTASNTTIIPDAVSPATLDDDRRLSVNNLTVNEGSPYAVFTVTGAAGQYVQLALANGTASSADYGSGLEYFNGTAWVAYTPNSLVQIPNTGTTLLVRTTITNDATPDNGETFTLTATNVGGAYAVGTATILDVGTGDLFSATNNTGLPEAPGTSSLPATLDDDRSLSINNVTVNEGSPYMVFTVSGISNEVVSSLTLANSTTGLIASGSGVDYGASTGTGLEYWDITSGAWVPYITGSVSLDSTGTLLVRTPIVNDTTSDNGETFKLVATNISNVAVTGIGTILDNGSGTIFVADDPNTTINEAAPSSINGILTAPIAPDQTAAVVTPTASTPLPDDDRPLTINDLTINEGSPYAVFTVGGLEGQYVKLALGATSTGTDATLTGSTADIGQALEYFNGTAWVAYTPGSFVQIPSDGNATPGQAATLLVRVAVINDAPADNGETFTLTATNTGALAAVGTGTILDNGTGNIFSGNSGTPDANVQTLSLDYDKNDAPAGTDNAVTILEDGSYTFSAADFGFSDPLDTPANTLQAVIITTLPVDGTLKLNGVAVTAGQVITAADIANLVYTPVANANGSNYANFTFQVIDDGGTANNGQNTDQSPNTITINITPVNDIFTDAPETVTTPEDTAKSGNLLTGTTSVDGPVTVSTF